LFTHPRPPEDELRLLGSVRRGPQMGALAIDRQGRYLQVNGDHVNELSQSQLAAAVERATAQQVAAYQLRNADWARQRLIAKPAAKPPVVVVRRRRNLEIS
jgi:hypothetical protein